MTRSILLLTLVLLVPIIPFLAFGDQLESTIEAWTHEDLPAGTAFGVIFGSLASDIFLPVPSSVICTFAGNRFGIVSGGLVSWLGLTVGSIAGYGLAYLFGLPLAKKLSDEQSLTRSQELSNRFGPWLVVMTRPVPVLAEATILWLGIQRVKWNTLLLPLAISNFAIAFGYAIFGRIAGDQGWFLPALIIAAAAPLVLWIVVQRWLLQIEGRVESDES